jgi:protein-tyrosine phosphatase
VAADSPLKKRSVNQSRPFIDIHCHLAPGLDDGAPHWGDALAMAEMAAADGIGTIVVTPHQLGSYAKNSGQIIRTATEQLQQFLHHHGVPLRVLPGADVRIEPDLMQKIRSGEVMTLADRHRHVLLELPESVYVPLDRLLAELASAGLAGILSHPERNLGILSQPDLVRPLVEHGCLMQVTAGSLTGTFGPEIRRFAESLVEQGLVHFIGTDAHGTKTRAPLLAAAFERVAELAGHSAAVDLCCRHPAAVATGEVVPPGCRKPAKSSSWTSWLRRTFPSEWAIARPI